MSQLRPFTWVSVDILKWVFAIWVASVHLVMMVPAIQSHLGWLRFGTNIRLMLFFWISGMLLTHFWHKTGYQMRHFPQFVASRWLRLLPIYLISIVMTVGGPLFWSVITQETLAYDLSANQIASHLLYLNDWLGLTWWQKPYWSIALYMQALLVLPFMAKSIQSGSKESFWLGTGALVLLALTMGVYHKGIGYYLLPFCLGGVWYGVYSGLLPWKRYGWLVALLLLVTAIFPGQPVMGALVGKLAFLSMLGPLLIGLEGIVPQMAYNRQLGRWSYGIFLLHIPIGARLINWLYQMLYATDGKLRYLDAVLLLVLTLGVVCVVVMFTHRYLELPMERFLKVWVKRKEPKQVIA